MELLKTSPRKGANFGDLLHVGANVAFVGLFALLALVLQLPVPAFLLALVSKWRIFAVRPRYWSVNIKSNLVDVIFILSVAALIIKPLVIPDTASAEPSDMAQAGMVFWLLLLAAWQLWLKPHTGKKMMMLQAGVAQFTGLMALFVYLGTTRELSSMNQVVFLLGTIGAWIIGYGVARHVMASYETETKADFYALLWGYVLAAVTWVSLHWMHVYPAGFGIQVPQAVLVMLLLSFCAGRAYAYQRKLSEDPKQEYTETRQALKNLYASAIFSAIFLVLIIASTPSWGISV